VKAVISVAFFNNQGGVGKTSLVYHCAWIFAELGYRVIAVDLDPQANLSTMALDIERLDQLWSEKDRPNTIFGALKPLVEGTGTLQPAHVEPLSSELGLIAGDLALSTTEDDLSIEWPRCLEGRPRAFRITTAFWKLMTGAAQRFRADVVLVDVGPNLGAINRAALVASSHVVMPVAADLFSLQGLTNLGPMLRKWRSSWESASKQFLATDEDIPDGFMQPVGYVLMQHAERLGRVTKAYGKWQDRLPGIYAHSVLNIDQPQTQPLPEADPNQLFRIKHYRSLMPLAMEARKPMFSLKVADGAIGAHQRNVVQCYEDFQGLTTELCSRIGIKKNTFDG
jgi:cellulose biosynthesis protein BcsQ